MVYTVRVKDGVYYVFNAISPVAVTECESYNDVVAFLKLRKVELSRVIFENC